MRRAVDIYHHYLSTFLNIDEYARSRKQRRHAAHITRATSSIYAQQHHFTLMRHHHASRLFRHAIYAPARQNIAEKHLKHTNTRAIRHPRRLMRQALFHDTRAQPRSAHTPPSRATSTLVIIYVSYHTVRAITSLRCRATTTCAARSIARFDIFNIDMRRSAQRVDIRHNIDTPRARHAPRREKAYSSAYIITSRVTREHHRVIKKAQHCCWRYRKATLKTFCFMRHKHRAPTSFPFRASCSSFHVIFAMP